MNSNDYNYVKTSGMYKVDKNYILKFMRHFKYMFTIVGVFFLQHNFEWNKYDEFYEYRILKKIILITY
jgi:hypothetical protein